MLICDTCQIFTAAAYLYAAMLGARVINWFIGAPTTTVRRQCGWGTNGVSFEDDQIYTRILKFAAVSGAGGGRPGAVLFMDDDDDVFPAEPAATAPPSSLMAAASTTTTEDELWRRRRQAQQLQRAEQAAQVAEEAAQWAQIDASPECRQVCLTDFLCACISSVMWESKMQVNISRAWFLNYRLYANKP